jgi:hypothetical protein
MRRSREYKQKHADEIRVTAINKESRKESTTLQFGLTHAKFRIAKDKGTYHNGRVKIIFSESLGIDNRDPNTHAV